MHHNELMDFVTKLSDRVLAMETYLKQTKKVHGAAYTKLKIKDTSKHGKSTIEEIDQDAEVTLVTSIQLSTQREEHSQEDQPEDQLGVFSAAKVLADIARRNVQTYTKRRAVTGSGRVSTASRMTSTAKELVSTVGTSMPVSTVGVTDKAMRLQEEFDEEERQRIARVHEVAQSFTEEEWENIRARIEADEELTQRL
uniref:Uncharacterized protein n=1 Tax=Tanacetum cinerariifolium TaxID=118510 RepID=A0A6L2MN01_TANCI|nr:hypothetical protein [Tanacetum cinerariifolium]